MLRDAGRESAKHPRSAHIRRAGPQYVTSRQKQDGTSDGGRSEICAGTPIHSESGAHLSQSTHHDPCSGDLARHTRTCTAARVYTRNHGRTEDAVAPRHHNDNRPNGAARTRPLTRALSRHHPAPSFTRRGRCCCLSQRQRGRMSVYNASVSSIVVQCSSPRPYALRRRSPPSSPSALAQGCRLPTVRPLQHHAAAPRLHVECAGYAVRYADRHRRAVRVCAGAVCGGPIAVARCQRRIDVCC